jgi:hypothetical protein
MDFMDENFRRKASRVVKLAVIGTPLFFGGCYGVSDTVVIERRAADRVEVVEVARPGYHYSYFYGGYVPIYVPLGGYVGPGYYSSGYRPPRTVVNNYISTHRTSVVRQPTTRTTTTTTTTRPAATTTSRPTTTVTSSRTSVSSGSTRATTSVRTGGFGATGRGSFHVGG